MKKITIGIVAHVDAGKTTCIESMLYQAGVIRKLGRVDHKDTVLDYDAQERDHGITIYAKEAHFTWLDAEVFVIDTPGHVDFSSEMERSLQVLDLAVMLINGQDGVQSHTETIWKCLQHYHVPTIIFVNKMDIAHFSKQELLEDIRKHCSDTALSYNDTDFLENAAMINDATLEQYTESNTISHALLKQAFYDREWFPVLFGSALKNEGIVELLNTIDSYSKQMEYPEAFGARVYKISMDENGNRLTHVKVTGGVLHAKDVVKDNEKVDQIRIYTGTKYELVQQVDAGSVCVLKGLQNSQVGEGYGFEEDLYQPVLKAYMNYELVVPHDANVLVLADTCKQLADEDPQLEISVDDKTKKIHVQMMGEMQMEVLQKKIEDKCGIKVGFSTGRIVYQETIKEAVEGAGHFEPLRHYAEVHVLLEPLSRGSGIQVSSACSSDVLSNQWQRSILTTLSKYHHRGVLTGSLLTDVKITLIAGKGNIKHTSGGDFRQASIRAVRQALMKAENILLEPFYTFTLHVPSTSLSKALYDLEMRNCSVEVQEGNDEMIISGKGPVRTMINYQNEVIAYTKGKGRFIASLSDYEPSSVQDTLVKEIEYDPLNDMRNPCDSVFCANGSGYSVPWDKADAYMHIQLKQESTTSYQNVRYKVSDSDLAYIDSLTSGRNRNQEKLEAKKREQEKRKQEAIKEVKKVQIKQLDELLIVDGYNMIYAWDSLKDLAYEDLSLARDKLITYLYNYLPYLDHDIWVVFDGYKVKNNIGSKIQKKGLIIIYTKADETADAFLEKSSYDLKDTYRVTYATSDALIQNAVFSQGAFRMSAKELETRLKMKHVILE